MLKILHIFESPHKVSLGTDSDPFFVESNISLLQLSLDRLTASVVTSVFKKIGQVGFQAALISK